ncbi:DUF6318 family protein [Cellulomonas sp. CW35]|uniref:DUF6318 domain-containing protein n=1 Tax=Cellulomonas uda TaxID=1714 RepID=A0A4Y3K897_CELUD|nr:DUF6318 family protein [Cellulomonas uda]NII66558.1 hypothetical protein [Cellulomonas uda]GEA79604.1 hypothetical protein CUD01_00480 [Cellulomonas uda]
MKNQGAITALALATLVLTACTDQGPAAPTTRATTTTAPAPPSASAGPTPTPSPTPSALPDVTVPPQPPAALEGPADADNAQAVAQYFMSLFPYVFATGDTTAWDELSGEDCGYCADITDLAAADRSKGYHEVGGHIEFTFASAMDFEDGTFSATIAFDEHPSQTVNSDGEVVEDYPGIKVTQADVSLEWRDGRWLVQGVDPTLVEKKL